MEIWLSSFIPKDIPGLSKPVPNDNKRTMFPGPLYYGCFLTDQRGFSEKIQESSRMRIVGSFNIENMKLLTQVANCNETINVDCDSGSVTCNKTPDSSKLKIIVTQELPQKLHFTFSGGANNPCVMGSPEINWIVHVELKKTPSNITVSILPESFVEPFPAFEMYASHNGITKILFQRSPEPGATPTDLIGDPTKIVVGNAEFPL